MIDRRMFIATAAATAALAGAARAQTVATPDTSASVAPEFMPQAVRVKQSFPAQTIVIVTQQHFLYYIETPGQAIRYGVGVGKSGLAFKGDAVIQVKKEWPTWRPTDDMIERSPENYAKFKGTDYVQPGGPGNPLGARALYLFQNGKDTYFRIHGTTEPSSIGRSVSSGCIRMINEHVMDLYNRVPIGTRVIVI